MDSERSVHADCVNAPNPYHKCADYCSRKKIYGDGTAGISPGRIARVTMLYFDVANGKRGQEEESAKGAAGGRGVDPRCINSSNPFHRCADYCLQRSPVPSSIALTLISPRRMEGAANAPTTQWQDVNPKCANAANPYHKCAEYCLQRTR